MSTDVAALVSDNLDLWTGAIERKSSAGRGGGRKVSLYGIERLRALILDLAVRGKLVPQDAGDEPARTQLAEIRSARPRFAAKHHLPKQRVLNASMASAPFDVPEHWVWTPLGAIVAYMQRGKSPKYSEGSGVFVVSQRCVQWAGLDLSVAKEISEDSLDSYEQYRFLQPGDLLWNSTGTGTIGRVIALSDVPEGLVCDSHVTLVRCPWTNSRYLQSWLASDAVYGQIEALAAGSTNQIEWTAQLAMSQLVPLPPLAEQQRIVAKVDELMALCDVLEAQSALALEAHQTLVETLLATLVRATDPDDLARQWARLEIHFDDLLTTDASVEALKRVVFQLAVQGKLTTRKATDISADLTLLDLSKKRTDLLKSDYPNKSEASTQIRKQDEQQIPQNLKRLPNGWCWATLMQCSIFIIDCKNKTAPYSPDGIRLIRTTNVRQGRMNDTDQKYVDVDTFEKWSMRSKPQADDLLITREAPMGEACLVPHGEVVCLGQRMMLCRADPSHVDPGYLLITFRSPDLMDRVQDKPIGMTVEHLRVGGVETLIVPVPPIAEQRRIVAKVDELLAYCDALKARIADAAKIREHLADAIVEQAAA